MEVVLTGKILSACDKCLSFESLDKNLRKRLVSKLEIDKKAFPLDLLSQVSSFLIKEVNEGEKGKSKYWLHELMIGSEVYIDIPNPVKRCDQLESRLQQLSNNNNNQQYYTMVSDIDPNFRSNGIQPNDPNLSIKDINQQLTAILNIAFTVIAVFGAVYWVSYTVSDDVAIRVLVALFAAILVGIAESALYLRYLSNLQNTTRSI